MFRRDGSPEMPEEHLAIEQSMQPWDLDAPAADMTHEKPYEEPYRLPAPYGYGIRPQEGYGREETGPVYGSGRLTDEYPNPYDEPVASVYGDNTLVAQAKAEEARFKASRSRTRWIGAGTVGLLVMGGGIYLANKFEQNIKAILPHTVTEVTDPTAALTSVKIDLRTPLIDAEGHATAAISNHVEMCPPLIGCHTVPLSGHQTSANIKRAELDVEADPGAIVLKPEKDDKGNTIVIAVIANPGQQIKTKVANEIVQTDGNSDFFPALAEAFHHSTSQSAMVDETRTVAEEEFQKSCAKALNPVIAPAAVARVRQSVHDIMPLLLSVNKDMATQVDQIISRPIGVQFGDGESAYTIKSPATVATGNHEADYTDTGIKAKAFESVVATPDCAISPAAQSDIMKESDKASGGYFVVTKEQAAQYGTTSAANSSNTSAQSSAESPASGSANPATPSSTEASTSASAPSSAAPATQTN